MTIGGFDQGTREQIVDVVATIQNSASLGDSANVPAAQAPIGSLSRFMLLGDLGHNEIGSARRLAAEKVDGDDEGESVSGQLTSQQAKPQVLRWRMTGEVVTIINCDITFHNFLPLGSHVNAIKSAQGWAIISNMLAVQAMAKEFDENFPNGPFSYAIFRSGTAFASTSKNFGSSGLIAYEPPWDKEATFLGSSRIDEQENDPLRGGYFVTDSTIPNKDMFDYDPITGPSSDDLDQLNYPREDVNRWRADVDEPQDSNGNPDLAPGSEAGMFRKKAPQFLPCSSVSNQPLVCTYEPAIADEYPEAVEEFLGHRNEDGDFIETPSSGQLWSPGKNCKLNRNAVALELFWWEYQSPDPTCKTITVQEPNPDYDPDNPICSDSQGSLYDPSNDICKSTLPVDKDVWVFNCENRDPMFIYDEEGERILCSDTKPDRRSTFFVAPEYWWAYGNWNFSYWYDAYAWSYPWNYNRAVGADWNYGYGYYGRGYNWRNGGYAWGPWGNWYFYRNFFNGKPPTKDKLEELAAVEYPDIPCGEITQRKRHSFMVWEWGWGIEGDSDIVNSQGEPTTIFRGGPLQYKTDLISDVPTGGILASEPPDPSN